MNTHNVNVKTAAPESSERWGKGTKPFIVQLEEMERAASKALFAFQTSGDKAALYQSGLRLTCLLREGVDALPFGTPEIQQKVNDISDQLSVMAHFSGREF